jgi:hypothetical protein
MTRTMCVRFLVFAALVVHIGCTSPGSAPVRALMKEPIAPASDAIFNAVAYTNGRLVAAPQSDADWSRLRLHAESLARAADALSPLAPDDAGPEWRKQSAALNAAAQDVMRGIEQKDLEQILSAGSSLYATCTGCHAVYVKE